ncbi:MAG: hypothetical protein HC795_05995 [Coleofasciculaceae cyanobacterium RL_1_1]|nr:hypothetical protein [Coleofasciculaceae cyanobacterium RL_1_1]
MNEFESTKLRTKFDNISEGWLVQIYNSDRRLLCVIDSSHAWIFVLGCVLGLFVAMGWSTPMRHHPSTTPEPNTTTTLPELSID